MKIELKTANVLHPHLSSKDSSEQIAKYRLKVLIFNLLLREQQTQSPSWNHSHREAAGR